MKKRKKKQMMIDKTWIKIWFPKMNFQLEIQSHQTLNLRIKVMKALI